MINKSLYTAGHRYYSRTVALMGRLVNKYERTTWIILAIATLFGALAGWHIASQYWGS